MDKKNWMIYFVVIGMLFNIAYVFCAEEEEGDPPPPVYAVYDTQVHVNAILTYRGEYAPATVGASGYVRAICTPNCNTYAIMYYENAGDGAYFGDGCSSTNYSGLGYRSISSLYGGNTGSGFAQVFAYGEITIRDGSNHVLASDLDQDYSPEFKVNYMTTVE